MKRYIILGFFFIACLSSAVPAQNNPPVLDPIGNKTIAEKGVLNFVVSASDPDGTDPLLYTSYESVIDSLPPGATFDTVGLSGSGTFIWQPDYTQAGLYDIVFYADDGIEIDSEVITVTVTNVNAPPDVSPIGDKLAFEFYELSFTVTATDVDGTIPSLSVQNPPTGSAFDDNLDGTGDFSWTPQPGDVGTYSVIFAAFDGEKTGTDTVNIFVRSNDNPPVISPREDFTILEGQLLEFFIFATDADGSFPVLSAANLPVGAAFADSSNGIGQFEWRPDSLQAGIYTITFYASDYVNEDTLDLTITVLDNLYPPVLAPIGPRTIREGQLLQFIVTATDDDGIFPELWISVQDDDSISFEDELNGTGSFSFTPDASHAGDNYITFYASDGIFTDSEVVIITVIPNLPPELLPIGSKSVTEGETLQFDVVGTDPDEGTTFILTADPIPPNATFTINADDSTAVFEFSPDYTQSGIYNITFTVSDGSLADTEIVAIEVIESGNQLPILATIGPQEVTEGQQLSFSVSASDADDTLLTIETSSLPENASFTDNGDGTGDFVFSPGCVQQGLYMVIFKVTDEQGGIDSEAVEINVIEGGNWPPVLDAIAPQSLKEGYSLEFNINAEDCEGEIQSIWIDPPVDDTIYGGGLYFEDLGNGTAIFEFLPGFDLVEVNQSIIRAFIFATDGIDVDSQEAVITVYNVPQDSHDPGEADTLVFESQEWNGQGDLAITCYVWNDSTIAGAITGFRWFDSSLVCDSVIVGEAIDTAYYDSTRIYNDSLFFGVEFIFYDSACLDTGKSEYFTAWFHLQEGATWNTRSKLRFDTTSVGNRGDFVFDWKLKGEPPLRKAVAQNLELLLSPENIYVPLVIMGQVRAALTTATDDLADIPNQYTLKQNYPNPFNPSTTIVFSIPRRGQVQVRVFNILGQLVTDLTNQTYEAGTHFVVWDGQDYNNRPVASGIYLYSIVTEEFMDTKKMVLLK